jgi:hypothetical protein
MFKKRLKSRNMKKLFALCLLLLKLTCCCGANSTSTNNNNNNNNKNRNIQIFQTYLSRPINIKEASVLRLLAPEGKAEDVNVSVFGGGEQSPRKLEAIVPVHPKTHLLAEKLSRTSKSHISTYLCSGIGGASKFVELKSK